MSKRGENIYKRKDGRWEGRYPKGRKSDGSLYYGYVYARSYKMVKEEVTLLRSRYLLKDSQSHSLYQGTTQEWVSYWLEELIFGTVKLSTYGNYTTKLRVHFISVFGDQPLQAITTQALEDWIKDLQEQLAISTIYAIFRIVRGCLGQAKKRGYLLTDPTVSVSLPPLPTKKPQAFSLAEQKELVTHSQTDEKALPVMIALETGMRVGEICGLKWEDIDFETQVIHIRRTVQRLMTDEKACTKTSLQIGSPKTTGSERVIPLSERLTQLLLVKKESHQGEFVLSHKKEPIDPRTISYRFKQVKAKLNLPDFSFHTLRHTFATRCVEMGVNIAAISAMLGHASIKMTLDVYTSSFIEDQRLAVNQLATL